MDDRSLRKCTDKIVEIMMENLPEEELKLGFGITYDEILVLTENIIEEYIKYDVERFFKDDPAATSEEVLIDSYKGIDAVIYYRSAHAVYCYLAEKAYLSTSGDKKNDIYEESRKIRKTYFQKKGRIISEKGAKETTIEIHPGAKIGRGLVIDHGVNTKIGIQASKEDKEELTTVIGETCKIGEDVTILNGVTLGAKSVNRNYKKHERRHPTIGDRVVICAGVRILGDITIGDDSFISPLCLITHSIPCNSKVSMINQLQIESNNKADKSIIYGLNCKKNEIDIFGENLNCKNIFIVDDEFNILENYKCKILFESKYHINFSIEPEVYYTYKKHEIETFSIAIEFEENKYNYIIRPIVLMRVIKYNTRSVERAEG